MASIDSFAVIPAIFPGALTAAAAAAAPTVRAVEVPAVARFPAPIDATAAYARENPACILSREVINLDVIEPKPPISFFVKPSNDVNSALFGKNARVMNNVRGVSFSPKIPANPTAKGASNIAYGIPSIKLEEPLLIFFKTPEPPVVVFLSSILLALSNSKLSNLSFCNLNISLIVVPIESNILLIVFSLLSIRFNLKIISLPRFSVDAILVIGEPPPP